MAASETGSDYHPIFFSQDRLLEELFCVCIQLLNKTWKEMRATQEDFDKVGYLHPPAAWALFLRGFFPDFPVSSHICDMQIIADAKLAICVKVSVNDYLSDGLLICSGWTPTLNQSKLQ